jgi:hypothetical protein
MRHRSPKRFWIVPLLVLTALAGAHGVALYHLASRLTWAVLLGLVVLVLLAHSGALSFIQAIVLHRSRRKS